MVGIVVFREDLLQISNIALHNKTVLRVFVNSFFYHPVRSMSRSQCIIYYLGVSPPQTIHYTIIERLSAAKAGCKEAAVWRESHAIQNMLY